MTRKSAWLVVLLHLVGCQEGNPNDDLSSESATRTHGSTATEETSASSDESGAQGSGNSHSSTTASTSTLTSTASGDTTSPVESSASSSVDDSTDATSTDSTLDDSASTTSSSDVPTGSIACGGKIYACGNQLDDDNDGRVDLADGECISPCDDDEASFMTLLPGQNSDCKADCYFDADSGGGNDHCSFDLQCDSENPGSAIGCAYGGNGDDPSCAASVPDICLDICLPRLPNGCDCFGCCKVDSPDAGLLTIYLGSNTDCSFDNIEACGRCTFQETCANPCDKDQCELCFGDDPSDLPEECDGDPTCPGDQQSCLNHSDCPEAYYCQTGCCLAITPG